MANPWEWTEEDLLGLVKNQIQESLTLDYKQSDSISKSDGKKKEISKDVAAFANSEGGTIVYGIKEVDNHYPEGLDEGIDPTQFSKEWLENVITSNIHPRIDGVKIKEVALSDDRIAKVAYVVYIPQSATAHMSADNRYYKRFNFKSEPMEDY